MARNKKLGFLIALYALSIPIFAFIYDTPLSGHFYHANTKHDYDLKNTLEELRSSLLESAEFG